MASANDEANGPAQAERTAPAKRRTLEDCLVGRDNNLNLIRALAAGCVLVSHAYPISLGPGATQPLSSWLGMPLGGVALAIFFVVSGLLVAQSWERSGLRRYTISRSLRIFPGLFVVLLLTAGVLGPLLTELPLSEYATRLDTWTYIPRNLLLYPLQYPLPGVFSAQPYGTAINGSLWTLVHEVACYVAIALLGVLGSFRRPMLLAAGVLVWILAASIIVENDWLEPGSRPWNFLFLSPYFAVGVLAYLMRSWVSLNPWGLLVSAVVVVSTVDTPLFRFIFPFALGFCVVYAAFAPGGLLRVYNRLGDYSYGIYIYAFPVQQCVAFLVPSVTPLQNMLLAFPPTLLFAALSWHTIEKRALAWRTRR